MSHLRPLRIVAGLLALALAAAACTSEPPAVIVSGNDPATSAKDIAHTLDTEGFVIFSALLERAGLTEALTQGEGDDLLTVFAPSDAAFAEMGAGVEATLMGEEDVIVVPLSDAAAAAEVGSPEDEAAEDGEAASTSGPESAVPSSSASQAPTATVEPLTESETADLLTAILEYHVVEGKHLAADLEATSSLTSVEGSSLSIDTREEEATTDDGEPTTVLTVDEADVTAADLLATNGVIHTVDRVLVPADREEELRQLIASIPVATDAMNTLRVTGVHDQLVSAIESAGLEDDLADAEAVTVFAPTDAAFSKLTAAQRAALEDPAVLRELLRYHVVGRTITDADVLNSESIETLEGERVVITKSGDTYTVNDVPIVREIPATNGVVHVIDELLVPSSVQGPGGL